MPRYQDRYPSSSPSSSPDRRPRSRHGRAASSRFSSPSSRSQSRPRSEPRLDSDPRGRRPVSRAPSHRSGSSHNHQHHHHHHPRRHSTGASSTASHGGGAHKEKYVEKKKKLPIGFLAGVGVSAMLLHKYWPKGWVHGEEGYWERMGRDKKDRVEEVVKTKGRRVEDAIRGREDGAHDGRRVVRGEVVRDRAGRAAAEARPVYEGLREGYAREREAEKRAERERAWEEGYREAAGARGPHHWERDEYPCHHGRRGYGGYDDFGGGHDDRRVPRELERVPRRFDDGRPYYDRW